MLLVNCLLAICEVFVARHSIVLTKTLQNIIKIYQDNFGESIVPYYRGFDSEQNQKGVGFPRMFQLYRGPSNSDRAQGRKASRLTYELARNTSTPVRTNTILLALR